MAVVIITGSAGLIGSEASRFLAKQGMDIVGIDNDMRSYFFGAGGSTRWNRESLARELKGLYRHVEGDIRDEKTLENIFKEYRGNIRAVIHTAAQPSHDWAAREPKTDFGVNAVGTLNLLEATRQHAPEAPFIFTSTNKVYGDTPNFLPLHEEAQRWEISVEHPFHEFGIDESMSIDQCKHSVFGASKVAADIMVQEYGRYFDMRTAVFRGGCLTGPAHSGVELHGFLAYLVKCIVTGKAYTVHGYKGKQVRDNIHSYDLVQAFWNFIQTPRSGEVYNMGGGRYSHCSMLEAIASAEKISGKRLDYRLSEENRVGDHIWWISDTRKFKQHYPGWQQKYGIEDIIGEMVEVCERGERAP